MVLLMYPWDVSLEEVLPIVQSLLEPWSWYIAVFVAVSMAILVADVLRTIRSR